MIPFQHHPESGQAVTFAAGRIAALREGLMLPTRGCGTHWRQATPHGNTRVRMTARLRQEGRRATGLPQSPAVLARHPAPIHVAPDQIRHPVSIRARQSARRAGTVCAGPCHEPAAAGGIEFTFYYRAAEDFAAVPSRALVVTRHANIRTCGDRFDLLEYFVQHALFAGAFMRYRPAVERDGHRLFLRQD